MKKNLLTLSVLAISLTSNAQEVLTHIDKDATFYVSPNTLVYNGGGLQTKDNGKLENKGNIMIDGTAASVVRNLNDTGVNTPTAGRIVMKINDAANPVTSTYGQLYIKGIPQSNITAIVDREYAAPKHGTYQQFGIPFNGKVLSELNTQLGASFNETRWSNREVLRWSNENIRFDGSIIPTSMISSATHPGIAVSLATITTEADRGAYFAMGSGGGLNVQTLKTLTGVPYAEGLSKTLSQNTVNFGANGSNFNLYRERYYSYVADSYEQATPWTGTFGKNIYQYSNPFLTNIDLSMIAVAEETLPGNTGNIGDGNAMSNVWGIYVNPNNVTWNNGTSTGYATGQVVTFDNNTKLPLGGDALLIRPFGTFKIKLRDSNPATLNFDGLRRFAYTPRSSSTSYSVTAARTGNTLKQLGVIALDANGNQIGETYYAVAGHFYTGYINNPAVNSAQAMIGNTSIIHTFEEDPTVGGIDQNYESAYRLYINQANEVDFKGKKIALGIYSPDIHSLKFEVREDAKVVGNGVHELTGGTGFYYTKGNGQAVQVKNGDVINVSGNDYALYYGAPSSNVLSSTEVKTPNRTLVVYNPDIENYMVMFDPTWKSADINVYDMSGKLVHTASKVKTATDYVLTLDKHVKSGYIVNITNENGVKVNTKILTK